MKKSKDPTKEVYKSLVSTLVNTGGFDIGGDSFKEALFSQDTKDVKSLISETVANFKKKNSNKLSESDLKRIEDVYLKSLRQWEQLFSQEDTSVRNDTNKLLHKNKWSDMMCIPLDRIPSDLRWLAGEQTTAPVFKSASQLFMKLLERNFSNLDPAVQFTSGVSPTQTKVNATSAERPATPPSPAMPQSPSPAKSSALTTAKPHTPPPSQSPTVTSAKSQTPASFQSHSSISAPKPDWVGSDKKALTEALGFLEATTKLMEDPIKNQKSLTKVSNTMNEKLQKLKGKDDPNSNELRSVLEKTLNLINEPPAKSRKNS